AVCVVLLVGMVLRAVVACLRLSTRLRSQSQAQLCAAAERSQRAETLAEELRRQAEADDTELDRLRRELTDLSRARAVAETQVAEAAKHVEEQKTLLTQARQELAESFQALSGEALKQNNEAVLA